MTFLLIVTIVSMVLAIAMSVVAWHVAREERERSDARVAVLAEDIHRMPAVQAAGRRGDVARLKVAVPVTQSADLFAAQPAAASSRPAIVVGVGLLFFATAAALVVVLGSSARRGEGTTVAPVSNGRAGSAKAAAAASDAARIPLELVALGHERQGDRLAVRGVVRNPASGPRVDGLTAVVFMFDRDGGFLGSGRGSIDGTTLPSGGDATFLVTVPGAADVARYRVSFRTETGIVAHVDKRTRP